jgi:hypothetical protein
VELRHVVIIKNLGDERGSLDNEAQHSGKTLGGRKEFP